MDRYCINDTGVNTGDVEDLQLVSIRGSSTIVGDRCDYQLKSISMKARAAGQAKEITKTPEVKAKPRNHVDYDGGTKCLKRPSCVS